MKRPSDCVASRVGNMKIHIQAIHDQVTYPFKVCFHEKSKHHAQESNWNKLHGLYYFQLQKWKKHEIDVISLSRKGSPQQLKKCMKKGLKSTSSAWVNNFWKAVHNCWIQRRVELVHDKSILGRKSRDSFSSSIFLTYFMFCTMWLFDDLR